MRSKVVQLAVVVCCVLCASDAMSQQRIRWYSNFNQAVKVAQQNNQLILLHFEMDNCAPCRAVERNVFPRPQVAQAVANGFVPVKLNYKNAKKLAAQLNVTSFPTDVIFTPQGKVLSKGNSPQDPQRYTQILNKVATGFYGSRRNLRSRIAKGPDRSNYAGDARGRSNGNSSNPNRDRSSQFADPSRTPNTSQFVGSRRDSFDNNDPRSTNGTSQRPNRQQLPNRQRSQFQPRSGNFAQGGAFDPDRRSNQLDNVAPPRGSTGFRNDPYGNPNSQRFDRPRQTPVVDPDRNRSRHGSTGVPGDPNGGGGPDFRNPQRGANPRPNEKQPQFVNNPYADRQGAPRAGQNPAGRSSRPLGRQGNASNPVCFEGYCPVTLANDKLWRKGDPTQSMIYQGRTYFFATSEARRMFAQQPGRFSPVLSGYDPVLYLETGKRVFGKRRHGLFVGGTIYLFSDEISLQRFKQAPDRYTNGVQQALRRSQNRRR